MLAVTASVAVLPIALVWELRATGTVTSAWLGLGLAVFISLAVSVGARVYWLRRSSGSELLFSELLLWGWVSARRSKRRLENAARLLCVFDGPARDQLTPARRAELLQQLADALDAQDAYLNGHSRRVARHVEKIARRMGLSGEEVAKLRAAAAIHDVGKLHVPRPLIDKPGRLTDDEFAQIKRHAAEGAAMVSAIGDPELTGIVRHHHERIDGRGYPDRLAGDQIPLGARIVAVADTFDAITSPRPYRPPARHRDALQTLRECSGTQLDPDAVRAFLSCYSGRRRFVLASLLVEMPQQALARAVGITSLGAASSSNVLATIAATAAVGAAAATVPAKHVAHHLNLAAPRSAFSTPPTSTGPVSYASGLSIATSGWTSAALRARGAPLARRHASVRAGHRHGAGPGASVNDGAAASTTAARGHRPATISTRGHRSLRPPTSTHARHNKHWTPPGRTGLAAPGKNPSGPPGRTGATPGQSGASTPGLRGQTPPDAGK